jgi:ubiquinone/menaquinone biosynthesis C-methylase UbiE
LRIETIREWQTVDSASDPREFIRYLERVSEHSDVRRLNRSRLEAAHIQAGDIVLDIGCGIGIDALMLAEAVGPSGQVHALDRSRAMVETTARRFAEQGLKIVCQEADAAALPYPDKTFDLVWLDRVLMHVPSPQDVLLEIRRVLKDGGQAVVSEPDSDALMISDAGDVDLARRLEQRWSGGIKNPRMGRALEGQARAAGFNQIHTERTLITSADFDLASSAMRWPTLLKSLVSDGEVSESRADAWLQAVAAEANAGQCVFWTPWFELFARR